MTSRGSSTAKSASSVLSTGVRPDTFWGGLLCGIAAIYSFATLPWIQDRTAVVVALSVLVGVLIEQRYPRVRVDARGVDLGRVYPFVPWERVERIERGAVIFAEPLPMSKLLVPGGEIRRARVNLLRTSAPLADAVLLFAPEKLSR